MWDCEREWRKDIQSCEGKISKTRLQNADITTKFLSQHCMANIILFIFIVLDTVPLTTWCQCAAELQFAYNYRAETRRGRGLTITATAIRVVTGTGRESEAGRRLTPTPVHSLSGYSASITLIVHQTTQSMHLRTTATGSIVSSYALIEHFLIFGFGECKTVLMTFILAPNLRPT